MSLYEDLGVSKDASSEEIKAAHRKAVKNHHPDAGGDHQAFQRVQLAYDTLKDPKRREHYDRTGESAHAAEPDPAIVALGEIFHGLMNEMLSQDLDIENSDIGKQVKDAMDHKIQEVKIDREKKERKLKKAVALAKRWKRKRKAKGFDFLGNTFILTQRDLNEQIAKVKEAEEIWKRARKILDDYNYKFDPKKPAPEPYDPFRGNSYTFVRMEPIR